ncbi:uncharacterized protein LOC143040983 [Oratosquilla oratoria]|uniref:uncharacterized protein LOC143040983 n=1 Tax=Oratosquilla oratoria TaxID=337810 RepID=UPI003F759142
MTTNTLVTLESNDFQKIELLRGSSRLKVSSFDVCSTLVALGANSGTIYLFTHEDLVLRHQIPTSSGAITQLCFSPEENQLALSSSSGIVEVLEFVALDSFCAQNITKSKEHEGQKVTCIIWSRGGDEVYIGDDTGRISVLYVPRSKAASIFQTSSVRLMTLDSSVIQMDYHNSYLLVSTLTRAYVCNTHLETFSQIGKKLRKGDYGACFLVGFHGTSSPKSRIKQDLAESADLTTSVESAITSQSIQECFEAVEGRLDADGREDDTSSEPSEGHFCIFCARPGTRLWEADWTGEVRATHQFKSALSGSPSPLITCYTVDNPDNEKIKSSAEDNHCHSMDGNCETGVEKPCPPQSVAFKKIFRFYNKYLLAYSSFGIYVIDPWESKVLIWLHFTEEIVSVCTAGSTVLFQTSNGNLRNLMITTVDVAILVLHSKGLYSKCALLCLKHSDIFATSQLLSRLGSKILLDVITNLSDEEQKKELAKCRKTYFPNDIRLHPKDFVIKNGVYYVKNEELNNQEMRLHLDSILKHGRLSTFLKQRCSSEPHLDKVVHTPQTAALSVDSSPTHMPKMNKAKSTSGTLLRNQNSTCHHRFGSEESLQYTMHTSLNGESAHGPSKSKLKSQSLKSSICSLESSQEFNDKYDDDSESSIRFNLDQGQSHGAYNRGMTGVYSFAYSPLHPGSDAAAMLHGIVGNVASNVVSSISFGTKTLKNKFQKVSVPKHVDGELPLDNNNISRVLNGNPKLLYTSAFTSLDQDSWDGECNDEIVVRPKGKKRSIPNTRESSVLDLKRNPSPEKPPERLNPDTPGVIKDLHELVTSTIAQISGTSSSEDTHMLLTHWLETYHSTVRQLKANSRKESLHLMDSIGDGPVSISSLDSSFSMEGSDVSGEGTSLHWDCNDIGYIPTFTGADMLEKITELFMRCIKARVMPDGLVDTRVLTQGASGHKLTEENVLQLDNYYAELVTKDCGFINYNFLLDHLNELKHIFLFNLWKSLVEKITKDLTPTSKNTSSSLLSQLEFTRSQYIILLHDAIHIRDMEGFINLAAKIRSDTVMLDVIYYLMQNKAKFVSQESEDSKFISKYIYLFLQEVSKYEDIDSLFLRAWCYYSELQYEVISAILWTTTIRKCECGMPRPLPRLDISMQHLLETATSYQVKHANVIADVCLANGYWRGYCLLALNFSLLPAIKCLPFALQSLDVTILRLAMEYLPEEDFSKVLPILTLMTPSQGSYILCYKCNGKLELPHSTSSPHSPTGNGTCKMTNGHHQPLVNGHSQVNGNIDTYIYDSSPPKSTETTGQIREEKNSPVTAVSPVHELDSKRSVEDITTVQEIWEAVVILMLRFCGSALTLNFLSQVQDQVPPGTLSQKVYSWCILVSLVEGGGPGVRHTLIDRLTKSSPYLFSSKVSKELQGMPPQEKNTEVKELSTGDGSPPSPSTPKAPGIHTTFTHHWGVHAAVLHEWCKCCHLQLTEEAFVREGGVTVFPCGHAYHGLCLAYRGAGCVVCQQLDSE